MKKTSDNTSKIVIHIEPVTTDTELVSFLSLHTNISHVFSGNDAKSFAAC